MADPAKTTLSRVSPEPFTSPPSQRVRGPSDPVMEEEETHAPYESATSLTQAEESSDALLRRRHAAQHEGVAPGGTGWHASDVFHGSYAEPSAAGEPTSQSRDGRSAESGAAQVSGGSNSGGDGGSASLTAPAVEGGTPALAHHSPTAVHVDPAAAAVVAPVEGGPHTTRAPAAIASFSGSAPGPPALTAAQENSVHPAAARESSLATSATLHTRRGFSNGAVPSSTIPAAAAALGSTSTGAAAAAAPPPPPPPPLPSSSSSLPPLPTSALSATAGATRSSSRALAKGGGSGGGGGAVPTTAVTTRTVEAAGGDAVDDYARPAVALSVRLLDLYKMVNARYCAQRRLESPGPKHNSGYDDKDGHYLFLPGEVIFQRYIAQEVLGKGSFGTVIRGFDQKRSEAVAMKITRRGASFRSQAKLELDILLRLNENPALNHLVVRLLKVFEWQGHLVLVFELLSFNLYQLIKCTRFNGVSLDLVRKFAYQLTHTLLQLESQKPHPIIHCDLKPENILLRNQNRSGIRLIDFGSACYTVKCFHRYIQSRFYRSPEVILFLEYGTPIDRWSLACVLVELHTGVPLFDGRTEAAQLAKFEATLGPIPAAMAAGSPKANRYFHGSLATGFHLKEPIPEQRTLESVIGVTTGGPRGRRLDTPGHDATAYREFHDFIVRFLRYQPEERMSCRDALRHPFLMPLYTSDLQQQQERGAASPPSSETAPPPPPSSSQYPHPTATAGAVTATATTTAAAAAAAAATASAERTRGAALSRAR